MRIFLCAASRAATFTVPTSFASSDSSTPASECVGFRRRQHGGGPGAGSFIPCAGSRDVVVRVLAHAPTFLDLLSDADRYFRQHRPDAVVLI